jgi:hypothetical protein
MSYYEESAFWKAIEENTAKSADYATGKLDPNTAM